MVALEGQFVDINRGVYKVNSDVSNQGAGDQGMMFGYACDETDVLMPMSLHYSHLLLAKYAELRKNGTLKWAYPDAKSQVTIQYVDGNPTRIDAVVFSAHHAKLNASRTETAAETIEMNAIRKDVEEQIIRTVLPAHLLDENTKFHINPTGRFETGGPVGDAGLTGRKIIVDTYGGHGAHGGGAFSGKDPSKVDRSAAYLGRYIAKNLVAAGMAKRCLVQLAYAIGVAKPVSVMVDTYGTGVHSDEALSECVQSVFDSRPGVFTTQLNMKRPIYQQTAAYGHFGRETADFTWERTDKVEAIKAYFA
jgi:S-adenosylmethionine synthetase